MPRPTAPRRVDGVAQDRQQAAAAPRRVDGVAQDRQQAAAAARQQNARPTGSARAHPRPGAGTVSVGTDGSGTK